MRGFWGFILFGLSVLGCKGEVAQFQNVFAENPYLSQAQLQPQRPVVFQTTTQKPINLQNNPFFSNNNWTQWGQFVAQTTTTTKKPIDIQFSSNPFFVNNGKPGHFVTQIAPTTQKPINLQQNPFFVHNQTLTPQIVTSPPLFIVTPVSQNTNNDIKVSSHLRSRCLKARGQFPTDACNKYVNCWDNVALEEFCPEGLSFNPKGYCDFAQNVDCKGKSIAATPITVPTQGTGSIDSKPTLSHHNSTTHVPIIDPNMRKRCLKPRGQFPTTSCNKYVNCWDDVAAEEECPRGTLFSEKGYCDYDYNVNCGQRSIDVSPQSLPQSTPTSNASPQLIQQSTFSVPSSASQSEVSSTNAPSQLVHQSISQSSSIPQGTPSTPSTISSSTPPKVIILTGNQTVREKCGQSRGQYVSTSCNKYINCWDGVVTEEECPQGMLFNEKGFCDYSYRVDCGNRTGGPVVPPSPECPVPYGTFRDKSNCSVYYTCISNHVAAKYECPNGLQYNDVIGVCDYSYRVDCTHDPLIFPPLRRNVELKFPSDFAHPPADCEPGTAYRLNVHCTSAAICRKGYTEVVECPAGFAYDGTIDKCTLVHLARC